jgi:hypothetical protein
MPNTDIDGCIIIILSEFEGKLVYTYLCSRASVRKLTPEERILADKLSYYLNLPKLGETNV